MLDLRRLAVFREVVRHGSFSAAADHLGYSQPAVSHHVSRLELEVGATLLHRRPKGLELTRLGQDVLRHADAILDLVHDAEGQLRDAVAADPDRIRLGGFQTSTEAVIRVALEHFWQEFPSTRVSLLEADPVDHIEGLHSGRLDLAIVFDSTEGAIADDRIAIERVHDDPLLVALPSGAALARRDAVRLADLKDARWLEGAGPDAASALVLVRACEPLGFEPDIAFACGNYHAVQDLVGHGLGVALIPELAALTPHPRVVLRPLADAVPVRRIGVAMLRVRHVPAVYTGMRRALSAAFAAYRETRATAP